MKQFQKQFDDLLAYWPDENQELRELRSTAFDQFKNLGIPTKQLEDWQFTDFSSLKKNRLSIITRKRFTSITG